MSLNDLTLPGCAYVFPFAVIILVVILNQRAKEKADYRKRAINNPMERTIMVCTDEKGEPIYITIKEKKGVIEATGSHGVKVEYFIHHHSALYEEFENSRTQIAPERSETIESHVIIRTLHYCFKNGKAQTDVFQNVPSRKSLKETFKLYLYDDALGKSYAVTINVYKDQIHILGEGRYLSRAVYNQHSSPKNTYALIGVQYTR